ncbi:MAG: family 78 glycoside hydrolase catalytic domain [Opitutales bacterium]|nr:family 78 glycoside hydrolase catalytic domain [Opitutales bacterium]
MKKIMTYSLFALAFTLGSEMLAAGKPVDVTVCDFYTNPLGYNLQDLSFSWKLPAERTGMAQSAYQIVVAENEKALNDNNYLWNSGKVNSDKSVKVAYKGKPFAAKTGAVFKVKYWDEKGEESEWSDIHSFEQGLLKNSDWKADWISANEETTRRKEFRSKSHNGKGKLREVTLGGDKPTYLRKEFTLGENIVKARAYVSCLGIFQMYINGKKIGNDFWGTGWTDYGVRVQSNTYDVTDALRSGNNTVGALLGGGWYTGRMGWNLNSCNYGDNPKFLAQIEIEYKDGKKQTIVTDSSWKWSRGPIVAADIYDGEDYDARLEQDGWNDTYSTPSLSNLWGLIGNVSKFDDSSWKSVKAEKIDDKILIEPRRATPVVIKDILYPISVRKVKAGTYIFDLGQNIVGWAKIKIPSVPDRKITIRFAEMLNQDGTMYTDNYRTARSIDTYTCSSYGIAEYEPTLTFHGFRYVELSGLPEEIEATKDWVEGKVVYTDLKLIGSFLCSETKINKLQSNIQWGQRCNFLSVPTDCPQRDERMGWLGDAQVFVPTAAFNMDVNAFFNKWTLDIRDATTPNGAFPDIAPKKKNMEAKWFRENVGRAAWADAVIICPWEIYKAYGDEKILRDNYEAMKKYIDFLIKDAKNYTRPEVGYGDWIQPFAPLGKSDSSKGLIGTAYFVYDCDIMVKVAKILGKNEDAKKFAETAQKVRNAFCKKYLKENGIVENDCQTSYLLALAFDILPENVRPAAFKNLLKTIERADFHLRTGFVGTPLLNPVLTKFGRSDLAYRLLLTETYPSWLYPINQGATTMWERWNSYSHKDGFGDVNMNSFNHYAYGAIGQWMYKDVAGLWNDENAAGYKNVIFAPNLTNKMSFATATLQTPYGLASSSWKRTDGVIEWNIVIPPNSTGTIKIPTKNVASVRINGDPLKKDCSLEDGYPVLSKVVSGKYKIHLREK